MATKDTNRNDISYGISAKVNRQSVTRASKEATNLSLKELGRRIKSIQLAASTSAKLNSKPEEFRKSIEINLNV